MGNNHSLGYRPQARKSRKRRAEAFTLYRPVSYESAYELNSIVENLLSDGMLPETTEVRTPETMRVTYLERNRMTRQLQGFAAGFNAREAIGRISDKCERHDRELQVSLGRVALMDRRDESLVVRLDHSQIIAEEYELVRAVLRSLKLPGVDKQQFKPHIAIARIPNAEFSDKIYFGRLIQDMVPDEATLQPLAAYPNTLGGYN